jgi:hypothetical protein
LVVDVIAPYCIVGINVAASIVKVAPFEMFIDSPLLRFEDKVVSVVYEAIL